MSNDFELITLNKIMGLSVSSCDYELDPMKKYIVDVDAERLEQETIMFLFCYYNRPLCWTDYHNWWKQNGFDVVKHSLTNSFILKYYGKKPLWRTEMSQGIVVKSTTDEYYIVMECSQLNDGYEHAEIILTSLGCL